MSFKVGIDDFDNVELFVDLVLVIIFAIKFVNLSFIALKMIGKTLKIVKIRSNNS